MIVRLASIGIALGASASSAQAPAGPVPGPYYAFFDWSKTSLTADAAAALDNAAAAYQQVRGACVELIGRSDRSGPASRNLRTSRQRAEAARAHLIRRAVPPDAIRITALGERQPIIPTANGVREAQNRSVEIRYSPRQAAAARCSRVASSSAIRRDAIHSAINVNTGMK